MSRVKNEKNGTIWCILSVPKYAIINLKINNFKQQLEQADSDKGPRIMPCSDRKGSIHFGDNLDYRSSDKTHI